MVWMRRRSRAPGGPDPEPEPRPIELVYDPIEEAPAMALSVDAHARLLGANRSARDFFEIDLSRLPMTLVEATREARLVQLLRSGAGEAEVRLTHRRRMVQVRVVTPDPEAGDRLLFLVDVTELRQLEVMRQEFVANLSHELRTPITSLRLAAESLLGDPPEETRRRFAERVVADADHLAAIVANLRELAEIEAGTLELRNTLFELAPLVHEVAGRLRLDRPLRIEVPEHLAVEADRDKLAQALANLLDNAARFSPAGSPIEIEAGTVDAEVRISVRDFGPGISPEHWSRVFERFYKVDPARSRASGGAGLGLAITKHLIMAQGGRIWTRAARSGGQRFTIGLPAVLTGH